MAGRPKIATSKVFWEAYSELPRTIQKKTLTFMDKFLSDPTQPGINFERISGASDDKLRSVRIDKAYRAIVVHPPKGDIFTCVWVGKHDDAYDWATTKRVGVNPTTGVFQIVDNQPACHTVAKVSAVEPEAALFSELDDGDLRRAGVPEILFPSVRSIRREPDLDALAPHMPEEVAEILYFLCWGASLEEALSSAGQTSKPTTVDVDDFVAALSRSESQAGFKVFDSSKELQSILNEPLDNWRIFLHPMQRELTKMHADGPVQVLGSAGTGKTVVLMHRAGYLAEHIFNADTDRILVTTFTRNLARDLMQNLKHLCNKEVFERIHVTNLHELAFDYLRRSGQQLQIASDAKRAELMQFAINAATAKEYPLGFYLEEWDVIVQGQDILDHNSYLAARRAGRSTRLNRIQRSQVWSILSSYRQMLDNVKLSEWSDVMRAARRLLEERGEMGKMYRAVLADEVQDFGAADLRLLRALAPDEPNSLFLVGDGHQRIYGPPIYLKDCGIDVKGRLWHLRINYRTTRQIRDQAITVLQGQEIDDLHGGVDTFTGSVSLREGIPPEVQSFARLEDEAKYIVDKVQSWLKNTDPGQICLAARTNELLRSRYLKILTEAGIPTCFVDRDNDRSVDKSSVRVATMHRLKGLEFKKVILVAVQEGCMPLMSTKDPADFQSKQREDLRERCLFYVASTRARDELVIVGHGAPSPYLEVCSDG